MRNIGYFNCFARRLRPPVKLGKGGFSPARASLALNPPFVKPDRAALGILVGQLRRRGKTTRRRRFAQRCFCAVLVKRPICCPLLYASVKRNQWGGVEA